MTTIARLCLITDLTRELDIRKFEISGLLILSVELLWYQVIQR